MRVGILGGGQLAGMLADAVARLGACPCVYDPDPDAPARTRVADVVTASFDDVDALRTFCSRCDVVTYDREHLPIDALRAASQATPFVPDLSILTVAQDRALEKAFLLRHGLPGVRHTVVRPDERLDEAAVAFGFPAVAKTTRGGYDGRGQFVLQRKEDACAAQAGHPDAAWILEECIAIAAEASCIVGRSGSEEVTFPVVENVHRDHILDRSLVPCRLPPEVAAAIRDLAMAAARALDARGLLAVEMFVATGGTQGLRIGGHRIYINELAPRPHNSGHVLARACSFGQFDALARILVGAPLGTPLALPGAFCLGNLLGDVWLAQQARPSLDLTAWRSFPEVIEVHVYGKRHPTPRRKMGHFIVQGSSSDQALSRAEAFRRALATSHTRR